MKVRRSRIKGPVEIVAVGLQHPTKIQNLKIKDGLFSAFDFGEGAAADVQTCKLKLSRKSFLRPPAFVAWRERLPASPAPLSRASPPLRTDWIFSAKTSPPLVRACGSTDLASLGRIF